MENICRTCLRIPKKFTDLYENRNLINKIETIASIEVETKEKYPSVICEECLLNVNKFYNFRKVIVNSDKDIRERFEVLHKTRNVAKPRTKERKGPSNVKKRTAAPEEPNKKTQKSDEEYACDPLPENDPESDSDYDNTSDNPFRESFEKLNNTVVSEENAVIQRALATCKIWKCKICKKVFDARFKLKMHKRTEHIAKGMCSVCGLVVRKDNLRKHIRLHSEKPLKCDECGKVCKNSESLRTHKLQHRGLAYTCEVCGKTFKTKSLHTSHMKCHLDPDLRKTQCPLCGKKVNRLIRHMISHSGERPYTCMYCKKGFTTPTALKVHTRQHTNEKPYICVYCPSAFTQNVSLKTHMKSKHGMVN